MNYKVKKEKQLEKQIIFETLGVYRFTSRRLSFLQCLDSGNQYRSILTPRGSGIRQDRNTEYIPLHK